MSAQALAAAVDPLTLLKFLATAQALAVRPSLIYLHIFRRRYSFMSAQALAVKLWVSGYPSYLLVVISLFVKKKILKNTVCGISVSAHCFYSSDVTNIYFLIHNYTHLTVKKEVERENEIMYDAIKEGGNTRILGHLMRVPASSYFFALSHLRKISTANLPHPYLQNFIHLYCYTRTDYLRLFPAREIYWGREISNLQRKFGRLATEVKNNSSNSHLLT